MIIIKNYYEIVLMREVGKIVGEILLLFEKEVKFGIIIVDLDRMVEEFIIKYGVKFLFKGLYGFFLLLCILVNE